MVVVSWVQSHWVLIAGSAVAVINELFAWKPEWKSNSLLQFLLSFLSAKPQQ